MRTYAFIKLSRKMVLMIEGRQVCNHNEGVIVIAVVFVFVFVIMVGVSFGG